MKDLAPELNRQPPAGSPASADRNSHSETPRPNHLPAVLCSVAATVLLTWPLAPHVADHVLGAIYYWDAYTNTMIMGGRVDAVLGRGPLSFYDNYFFAPLSNTIAFNENLFGISLLFAPFYLILSNPLLAYNLTLLLSMALSVFFTYLLVVRLTNNRPAGLIAGVAFAFSPYVLFEVGRLQLAATQWIPACFLFLHRAVEKRRWRDVIGLWVCYLLQIGTCLYYAMFLIPLLALAGLVLFMRQRPPKTLFVKLQVVGALAAAVALAMVRPYFASRKTFDLERTLSFASSYDGKLSFFANVHSTNLTLTGLHHQAEFRGAHEEIAFPGFTVLALVLLALCVPLWRALSSLGVRSAASLVGRWARLLLFAAISSLFAHSMLVGVVVVCLGVWQEAKAGAPHPFAGGRGLYLGVLLVAVLMFLGLQPLKFRGTPVHGLYYYFYTYVPGFNGIRKVSRQAVMTTFMLAVLASFGSAWLFARLSRFWAKAALFVALIAATCIELRSFPHPIKRVWAGETVPEAYRFLATLAQEDLVATYPQNTGTWLFRGDHGLALQNYLMLYHKHRSLNGQSSWEPAVTNLVSRAISHLPDDGARRILQSVKARHLLIHGAELDPQHRKLPGQLASLPQHYRRVFQSGSDHVFGLVGDGDPTLALVATPSLPQGARIIPSTILRARSSVERNTAFRAIDGNAQTFWSTRQPQSEGQTFELTLTEPHTIVAFEIENPRNQNDLPMAYELSVANGGSGWQAVAEEPKLRVFYDLVYSPKSLFFRVVLPTPVMADRVRLTLRQPVPGAPLTIHEARLYEQASSQ